MKELDSRSNIWLMNWVFLDQPTSRSRMTLQKRVFFKLAGSVRFSVGVMSIFFSAEVLVKLSFPPATELGRYTDFENRRASRWQRKGCHVITRALCEELSKLNADEWGVVSVYMDRLFSDVWDKLYNELKSDPRLLTHGKHPEEIALELLSHTSHDSAATSQ